MDINHRGSLKRVYYRTWYAHHLSFIYKDTQNKLAILYCFRAIRFTFWVITAENTVSFVVSAFQFNYFFAYYLISINIYSSYTGLFKKLEYISAYWWKFLKENFQLSYVFPNWTNFFVLCYVHTNQYIRTTQKYSVLFRTIEGKCWN